MKKRTKIILLIPGSIIVFVVLVIAVFGINIVVHRYQSNQMEEYPMPAQELSSFLISEGIQGDFDFQGRVKKISGSDLVIRGFNIETEEPLFLVVPISQAEIISLYILPEGDAKEEIAGSLTTLEEKEEYNIGEKQVGFDKIKLEDNLCISLKVKPDHTIEEMVVWSPVDLIQDLK